MRPEKLIRANLRHKTLLQTHLSVSKLWTKPAYVDQATRWQVLDVMIYKLCLISNHLENIQIMQQMCHNF